MNRPPSALLLALVVLVVSTVACGGSSGTPVFIRASLASQRFSLANGLDVVLHPDPSFRSVAVNVRYEVGSKHDPRGRSGLAHLVEHLTFRAKPDRALDAFSLLEQSGSATHNATTWTDATCYFESVPSEELPTALFVEAARMARPLDGVDDAAFAAERAVVLNERRQRIDNVPYANLEPLAKYVLLEHEPYGTPTVGFADELQRLRLVDAERFVATYYRPNNATLVVAGGFEPRRAAALIHELFDAIPGGPIPPAPEAYLAIAERQLRVQMQTGVDAPGVVIAWLGPPAGARGWHELVLASKVLGGWTKYWLRDSLHHIWAGVDSMDSASILFVHAELARGASTEMVVKRLEREIEQIMDPSFDIRLGAAKSHAIASQMLDLENILGRADALQTFVARYDDPNSIQAELHDLSAVRRTDLVDAVDRFLRRGKRVVVEAVPNKSAARAGDWPKLDELP